MFLWFIRICFTIREGILIDEPSDHLPIVQISDIGTPEPNIILQILKRLTRMEINKFNQALCDSDIGNILKKLNFDDVDVTIFFQS